MSEPAPLQPINRTYVRHQGRTLSFFGGCDYFRLSSHPRVLSAIREGLDEFGLNVAASRKTTGNHALYLKLEKELAKFFGTESALLVNSGYVTSSVVAQALAGQSSHALIDERAHVALQDASLAFDCPVLKFKHRDPSSLAEAVKRCGIGARVVVLTDGMFAHDGSVAPLREYLKLLPRDALLLVDDAHGAGTLGKTGKGAVELEGIRRARVVQCVTLSKAFGVYGGAVIGPRKLRERMMEKSRLFIGSTPLPLPLAAGALAALDVMRRDKAMRRRLNTNSDRVKHALREAGLNLPDAPGPIIPLPPMNAKESSRLQRALLAAKIFPSFLKYPGGPAEGYFRFVISSEHTRAQLDALVRGLCSHTASH
ncbi:MAG: aminotransferase class I/II-fold pyridoxal phosphate-dependent enzyme [Verrucomicrobia bacterium]|nr:MAG: aminotransferase class I/II-fold pyridoxal phosphate-dependent enzyme [Verrucomicrobiota bacterium]